MNPHIFYFNAPDKNDPKGYHVLSYTEWGDPKNTNILFCVHGLSRNARDFDYLADRLSKQYRVICLDVVGRGKSQYLEDKSLYTYETYVTDILAIFKHLDLKNVDFLGTSMGGIIGMITAGVDPSLINKLILNDIGPFIPAKSLKRILKYVSSTSSFATHEKAEAALRIKLSTFGIKRKDHFDHITKYSIEQKDDGKHRFTYDPAIVKKPRFWYKIPDIDLWEYWEKVNKPTLIIRGKDSTVLNKDTTEKMLTSKPNIKLVEFEDIGHAPTLMDDEQIEVVEKWLANPDLTQD